MTAKQLGLLGATAVATALVLAACGADPTPTPEPTSTPLPQATPTPDEAARFQAEWDALIEAAQAEGDLTMSFGGQASENYRPLVEFFEEKFGIKVVTTTGSGSASANRVLAERAAGQYLVDVIFGGVTSSNTRLVPANALDPIAELFIHPEVTDQSLWFQGRHWYADEAQQYVFTLSADAGGPVQSIRYNTDLVTQEDLDGINSVWDYVDPARFAGKIVAIPPLTGGAGGTYFRAYVHPDIGKEWVDAFVDPALDVTFLQDFRLIVDGIAKGQYHFGFAIGSAGRDLDALAALGAPVEKFPCTVANVCVKEFKEGGVMEGTGSQSNFMIPTNRPNPNAAKLFVNWFLTQEGQTIMHTLAESNPNPTLRTDVTDWGKTLPYERRDPDKDYFFFSSDPKYTVLREEALQYAVDAYNATH